MKDFRKRTGLRDLRAVAINFEALPVASQFAKSVLFLETVNRKIPGNTFNSKLNYVNIEYKINALHVSITQRKV